MRTVKIDRTYWVIFVLLVFVGMVSWSLYFKVYSQHDTVNVHLFPQRMGSWSSIELAIPEEEYELLETRNAFVRRYSTPEGKEVYLFVVYSQNNRKVSHPPEICYTGSGATIIGKDPVFLTLESLDYSFKVNKLILELNDTVQLAYYWFKVGDRYTANYWKQQGLIAVNSLVNRPASSAMIRVSSTLRSGGEGRAEQEMKEFIKVAHPYLQQYLP